jgi:hypothetical protein
MTLVSFIPAALGAQGVLADEDGKAANERKKVAARAKQADAFCAATEPLDITLTRNIRRIRGDKEDTAPWRLAVFSYSDTDGKVVTIPAQIRTRGIWRLKNCEFPPLRVNFRNEDTKGTLLRGIDKPKLVNYCRNTDAFETYITQEMQLYRVYNLLTPASHRARMLRITYVDSASGKTHAKRLAILLEEPDFIAARMDGDIVEQKGATVSNLDAYHDALAGLFNYFIGNTDWSTYGLHNMQLVSEADGDVIPIPYDFDFAGAINASYASVDPKLRIDRVRQRLFRGYCRPAEEFERAFEAFKAKKQEIYALYSDPVGSLLPKKTADETLKYFDEFYETISDSRRARRNIIDACLK